MAASEIAMIQRAYLLAEEKLASDDLNRWLHVERAYRRACEIWRCAPYDADILLSAVLLHDIGKSPEATKTGFWPLDGAAYLLRVGAPPRLANLVANCAGSRIEGVLRGYAKEYEELPDESSPVRDALWFCCLTTGPKGQSMTLDERLTEWQGRYADDPIIMEYCRTAVGELRAAITRTETCLERIRPKRSG